MYNERDSANLYFGKDVIVALGAGQSASQRAHCLNSLPLLQSELKSGRTLGENSAALIPPRRIQAYSAPVLFPAHLALLLCGLEVKRSVKAIV